MTAATATELREWAGSALAALAVRDARLLELAERQRRARCAQLNLVAASSPTLPEALLVQALGFGSVTAEGYPGRRYHPGAEHVDEVELLARRRAEQLFGASYANVQPLSGSAANTAVLHGVLRPGDRVVSLELTHGGHLSHVSARASSARWIKAVHYRLDATGAVAADELVALLRRYRPRLLICGGSACPREIDFAVFRRAADEVGALLLADLSHISGLVATGEHPSPVEFCDVISTSTYKQLCGPRGGLLLRGAGSRIPQAELDRVVFPGMQGTPDFGSIAAKAVVLRFAAQPAFARAMRRVRRYARMFATELLARGIAVVGGGTDTHLVLADLRAGAVTGRLVCDVLQRCGVLVNKNLVPDDPRPAGRTSGIRLGTNELAFRAVDDAQVAALAGEVAEVVAQLHAGVSPDRCQATARLTTTVAEISAAGFGPEFGY